MNQVAGQLLMCTLGHAERTGGLVRPRLDFHGVVLAGAFATEERRQVIVGGLGEPLGLQLLEVARELNVLRLATTETEKTHRADDDAFGLSQYELEAVVLSRAGEQQQQR